MVVGPTESTTVPTEAPADAPARILLVDDSEHDRRFCRRLLEEAAEPYEISECEDGASALEKLKGEKFDLLLADLKMPGMSGIDLIREAEPLLRNTGVIILTGTRSFDAASEALRLHVIDYMLKEPREMMRDTLTRQVRRAVAQIRLIRENRRLQRELRLRLTFLEQIHRQMPDTVFATIDRGGKLIEINEEAAEWLGLDAGDSLVGRGIADIFGGLSAEIPQLIKEHLAARRPIHNHYVEAASPTGAARLLLMSLHPVASMPAEHDEDDEIGPSGSSGASDLPWVLMLRDVTEPEHEESAPESMSFHGLVGKNQKMLDMCRLIRRVAPLPTSVLIIGPTGSGKELVARAVHLESTRAKKPFVAVNCTALSSEILESELFGHAKGAFTGAISARKGRFREADGGTLFLDEIGDTSESFQTKLLRALETGEIEPVGQDRPLKVDVRIVCATNQDLEALIRQGKFREDLFFRINVVKVVLPALRDRPGDLPLLVETFRQEFNRSFKMSIRFVTQGAMRALAEYDWPGNVRELRHALEHAFVVAEGPTITKSDLPAVLSGGASPGRAAAADLGDREAAPGEPPASGHPSDLDEAAQIRAALAETDGKIVEAANLLGMHRTTLWRKLGKLGIKV